MYNLNEKIQISSAISEDHPAYLEILTMDNRAEFIRTLMGDLFKVNPNLADYMKLSEEERMKNYFGVSPSEGDEYQNTLDDLAHMMADEKMRRKLELEVLYVSMFEPYQRIYAQKGECPFPLIQYFASHYAGRTVARMENDDMTNLNAVCAFSEDVAKFLHRFPPEREVSVKEWREKVQVLSLAERVFLNLCADMSIVCTTEELLKEDSAGFILVFMEDYLQYGYHFEINVHTAFFRELKRGKKGRFRRQDDVE